MVWKSKKFYNTRKLIIFPAFVIPLVFSSIVSTAQAEPNGDASSPPTVSAEPSTVPQGSNLNIPIFESGGLLPTNIIKPPGADGLLPIVIQNTGWNDTATDGADTEFDPSKPTNYDEAVALYDTIQTERYLAQISADELPAARQEMFTAELKSREASAKAASLKAQAEAAQIKADTVVRNIYMNATTPTLANFVLSETPEEAEAALRIGDQMDSAADSMINTAQELKKLSDAADIEAIAALGVADAAKRRVTDLENEVTLHLANAEKALAAYNKYITQEGPQVEVGLDGCPKDSPANTLRDGSSSIGAAELCRRSVAQAKTPQAALAIKWAFSKLGAPYACKGIGRMAPWRFDCSSLVSRAYFESSGIPVASANYAPSTRNMMPWDGVALDPHYELIETTDKIAPGDLLLYRSCTSSPCSYQHVVMALSDGYILHTNSCGDVAHVAMSPGYGESSNFVVARRVKLLEGENIPKSLLVNASNVGEINKK